MPGSIYVINGRVTRRDTDAGIHGLRVEAWDQDRCHDDYLGVNLTNRDGSFLIRFSESNFKKFVTPTCLSWSIRLKTRKQVR